MITEIAEWKDRWAHVQIVNMCYETWQHISKKSGILSFRIILRCVRCANRLYELLIVGVHMLIDSDAGTSATVEPLA